MEQRLRNAEECILVAAQPRSENNGRKTVVRCHQGIIQAAGLYRIRNWPGLDSRYRGRRGRVTEVNAGGSEGLLEIELDSGGPVRELAYMFADAFKVVEELR